MREILVLGGGGLAGRAIVRGLIRDTSHEIVAAGRSIAPLQALSENLKSPRLSTRVLDVTDSEALRQAVEPASLVINAVGPFGLFGSGTARTVIESGTPYLDCANEQIHYERLQALDALARERGVPMITAAGAIPGLSTLLIARGLKRLPDATGVDCCWAQSCHAFPDSGLASIMSGLLDVAYGPVALREGQRIPVQIGQSQKTATLPEPFGRRRLLEVPTVDALVLPQRFKLRDLHTWFYLGEQPLWLLQMIKFLQPHRSPLSYRFLEMVMRRVNAAEGRKAAKTGVDPCALLSVEVWGPHGKRTGEILFKDGALPTASLPLRLADEILSGRIERPGLMTPLDLLDPDEVLENLGDLVLRSRMDFLG